MEKNEFLSNEEREKIVEDYEKINLLEEMNSFELKSKYSFNVRNSYDAMKYELLLKAYNELTLEQLLLKLK